MSVPAPGTWVHYASRLRRVVRCSRRLAVLEHVGHPVPVRELLVPGAMAQCDLGAASPRHKARILALCRFVSVVEASGGLVPEGEDKVLVPAGDTDRDDLGDAYLAACEVLDVRPKVSGRRLPR